jgi:uncharacterized Zn finger protein
MDDNKDPKCAHCGAQGTGYIRAKETGKAVVVYCRHCGHIHGVASA